MIQNLNSFPFQCEFRGGGEGGGGVYIFYQPLWETKTISQKKKKQKQKRTNKEHKVFHQLMGF